MPELKVDNGTPSKHCGILEPHPKHQNVRSPGGKPLGLKDLPSYCDGVPPLEPFVELTIRASVRELFGEVTMTHDQALCMVSKYGLGMLVDCIDKPETAKVLRVRSGDGKDKVYPLISREAGMIAVVDAPGFSDDAGN